MAQVIEHPIIADTVKPAAAQQSADAEFAEYHVTDMFEQDEKESVRRFFGWPPSPGLVLIVVFAAILGGLALYVFKTLMGPVPGITATAQKLSDPSIGMQLSAQDLKEIAARDTYAVTLLKELHRKVPAYKNVQIYADTLVGTKSPLRAPHVDSKMRTGNNLMLVFSSPEEQTAKGLADFAKSKAVLQAAAAGFEEFQFVDPSTYCYSLVTEGPIVGAVKCGIR